MEPQSSLNLMDNIFFIIKCKKKKKIYLKKKYTKKRVKKLFGIIKKKNKISRSVKKLFRSKMRKYWKKKKYFSKRKFVYIGNRFRFQKINYKYKQKRKNSKRKIRKMFISYYVKKKKKIWINKPKNKGKHKYKGRRKWVIRLWRYKPKKRWIFKMDIIKLRKWILRMAKFKKLVKIKKKLKQQRKKIFLSLKNFNRYSIKRKIKKKKLKKLFLFLKKKINKKKTVKIIANIKKLKKVKRVLNFYFKNTKKKRFKRIRKRFYFFFKKIRKIRNLKIKKKLIFCKKTLNIKKHYKIGFKMIKKFNKLKKILEHRRKKIKSIYLTTKTMNDFNLKKTPYFSIDDHMFLHKYTHEHYLIKFYSNRKLELNQLKIKNFNLEKKKTYTYFFNFRNKKLKTYKNARNIHWGFFLNKTNKERRYRNFLKYFLKNQNKYILNMFDYFTFKFKLSYIFWLNFTTFLFYFYKKKLNCKEIYQFPINLKFWGFLNCFQFKKKKINTKLHSWVVKKNKIKKTFWMQQKKNFPKFLKKKTFWNNQIKNNIQYDFITNYFVILKNVNFSLNNQEVIFKNRLLKLNGFRYKA